MDRILVRGLDNNGKDEDYGSVEFIAGPPARVSVNVRPGNDAKAIMDMVMTRRLSSGKGKPLDVATKGWFDMLTRAYAGSRMWCVRG
jgi:hypothetical protein